MKKRQYWVREDGQWKNHLRRKRLMLKKSPLAAGLLVLACCLGGPTD